MALVSPHDPVGSNVFAHVLRGRSCASCRATRR